jgi:hypothetical protein
MPIPPSASPRLLGVDSWRCATGTATRCYEPTVRPAARWTLCTSAHRRAPGLTIGPGAELICRASGGLFADGVARCGGRCRPTRGDTSVVTSARLSTQSDSRHRQHLPTLTAAEAHASPAVDVPDRLGCRRSVHTSDRGLGAAPAGRRVSDTGWRAQVREITAEFSLYCTTVRHSARRDQ